jgi:hypothetical protein
MTEDQADKAIRLLNIIDALVINHDDYCDSRLPFTVLPSGTVVFDERLSALLSKPENADLVEWAHHNIASLFE